MKFKNEIRENKEAEQKKERLKELKELKERSLPWPRLNNKLLKKKWKNKQIMDIEKNVILSGW